jgi:hypothetical protein
MPCSPGSVLPGLKILNWRLFGWMVADEAWKKTKQAPQIYATAIA